MSGDHVATGDAVPESFRSWAYAIGTFVTASAVVLPEPWARYAAGVGTACLALATAYRPTRR